MKKRGTKRTDECELKPVPQNKVTLTQKRNEFFQWRKWSTHSKHHLTLNMKSGADSGLNQNDTLIDGNLTLKGVQVLEKKKIIMRSRNVNYHF